MTCSKNLSDYDRDFMKMLQESKLLIVDLDGTLIDFEKIDNMIIKQLFPDSRIIDTIDNILWKVNRLDVLGNGYAGLKIRLAVYSMFSKYTLKECKRMYGAMYEELARVELASVYASTLSKIIANGYKVAIVTKNVYAKNLLERSFFKTNKEISDNLSLVILRKDKKKKFKDMVKQYEGKVCVIGNNLSDDIMNSYKIGSPFIYIGKSKAINFILSLVNKIAYKIGIKSIYNRGIQFRTFRQVGTVFEKKK
ncbi:MAG: hypothetical protein IJX34_01190 [Clostridia bacterium]|nr:hypothetical protein [Clostridia bacterium]